ncbi:hypothetical protein Daura_16655 [Dactylosporangium aurantiacum]|uniref:Uncharacterized protein n=1 Tax=Dactylosporangium aurantiacum TaxID=35754 RepID=A0A9Q9IRF3_9ACTN|nr:hypothetical protein Daura_16655 [Dactylosporangium aurantiacum]
MTSRAATAHSTTAAAALPRTYVRRAPARSTSGPPSACIATYGASSAKAIRPVRVALPVEVSTSQGIARADIDVPSTETS